MTAPAPRFSVVIPTLNAAQHLAGALESLAAQDCRDFEVLIVDGVSTDGTPQIAESFRPKLPKLVVLSGKDKGVYGAINRGIGAAIGEWVLVLGSDDRLHQATTLREVSERLQGLQSRIAYGDVMIMGTNEAMSEGERYAGRFSYRNLVERNVCQQSIFYRRELFSAVGLFDPRFRVCADWAFLLRHFLRESPQWIDVVVADYHAGGLSSRVVDHAFFASRPMILLRAMMTSAFNEEATADRWLLRDFGAECARSGRTATALLLRSCWLALAILNRLSGKKTQASGP